MKKQITADISSYKGDFFKGLSIKETFFGGLALGVGVAIILVMHFRFKVNINTSITTAIPFMTVIGLSGFYTFNGMSLRELVKNKIRIARTGTLTYESGHEYGKKEYLDTFEYVKENSTKKNKS